MDCHFVAINRVKNDCVNTRSNLALLEEHIREWGRVLAQFQEKWTPVFRPELREIKSLDQFGISMKWRSDLG